MADHHFDYDELKTGRKTRWEENRIMSARMNNNGLSAPVDNNAAARLALEINRHVHARDGDRAVNALAEYMKMFEMTASVSSINMIPVQDD
ncbi:MAG: hypothetical protein AAGF28_10520 [Pseudomonadota bacterium]